MKIAHLSCLLYFGFVFGLYAETKQLGMVKATESVVTSEADPTVQSWAKQQSKPSYTPSEIGAQTQLVSGVNIKTVNGETLLGSGNIEIQQGEGVDTNVVQEIIQRNVETNHLFTVAAAAKMTNDMEAVGTDRQIVRGEYDSDIDRWSINVDYATGAEEAYSVTWDNVSDTPTTLEGYGISDAYTKSEIDGTSVTNGGAKAYADDTFLKTHETGTEGTISWIGEGIYVNGFIETSGEITLPDIDLISNTMGDFIHDFYAKHYDATNAAEAVFSTNADYALTNLVGSSVCIASGQIGSVTLDAATTNLTVTLDFSAFPDRSGDCLLYLVNATNLAMRVGNEDVTTVGWDGAEIKSGTNLVMFTRLKREADNSLVMVSTKEVR